MSARELWPNMLSAAQNLRPDHLIRLGTTPDAALAAGGIGFAKTTPLTGRLFEFGGDLSAAIVPVFWGSIPTTDKLVADNELIDLLAFNPSKPEQWWLFRGDAVFLNAGALDDLYLDAPLQIHRTPLGWLRSGAKGCVVLDWRCAASRLRSISTLSAEDVDHAKEIRRHLQQPQRIPEIRFSTDELRSSA